MSVAVADRPSQVAERAGSGGPARRAVVRWGWRLFRREWRRHVLILAMLTVAVAATIVGMVENPLNLLDQFALVPPGQAAPAASVSILTSGWRPGPGNHIELPSRAGLGISSRGKTSTAAVDGVVLALGTVGLLFVGLMAV